MIKAVKHIMIIYINHFVIIFIVWQFSLNIINIEKLNLQFIQTFKYLQQFCLNIHYKSDKINVVLNILSYLTSCELNWFELNELSFDVLHIFIFIYANTFIKISSKFWQCILDSYIKKFHWQEILNIIKWNKILSINAATLFYT